MGVRGGRVGECVGGWCGCGGWEGIWGREDGVGVENRRVCGGRCGRWHGCGG